MRHSIIQYEQMQILLNLINGQKNNTLNLLHKIYIKTNNNFNPKFMKMFRQRQ